MFCQGFGVATLTTSVTSHEHYASGNFYERQIYPHATKIPKIQKEALADFLLLAPFGF
jgi:hypothetical protein